MGAVRAIGALLDILEVAAHIIGSDDARIDLAELIAIVITNGEETLVERARQRNTHAAWS